jgi:hypothetical protein
MFMSLFMQAGIEVVDKGLHFPVAFTLVYVVGFIAAISIGSIAWYNSKRPAGWESRDRPAFVPKVEPEQNSSDS